MIAKASFKAGSLLLCFYIFSVCSGKPTWNVIPKQQQDQGSSIDDSNDVQMRDGSSGSHPHIDAPELKFANTQPTLQALLTKMVDQSRKANPRLLQMLTEFGLGIPRTPGYERQGVKRSFDSIDFGSDFSSFNNDGQGLGGANSLGARVFEGRRPSPFDLDIFDHNEFFMGRGHPFLPRQTRLNS